MATSAGPNISLDGLVFGYDNGHPISHNTVTTRFNQGKPTTNLISAYNDNHVRAVTWTNSGTWQYDHNASNNTKPVISNVDMSKVNLMHGKTLTVGSQHFGCASQSVSASTTYTMSVYYFQNRAGASQPYFRQSVNNNNLGNLKYNGSTNTSNWPVGKWIRISVTVTTASNENGCYLSNYLGRAVDDQVWYCAPMIEQNTQLTPFVDGTRSTTQSLIDLKESYNIDVDDVSFDSTGKTTFDGTDDYLLIPLTGVNIDDACTIEGVLKRNSTPSAWRTFFNIKHASSNTPFCEFRSSANSQSIYTDYYNGTDYTTSSSSLTTGEFGHAVSCYDGVGNIKMYFNGELTATKTGVPDFALGTSPRLTVGRAYSNDRYTDISAPVVKVYDRVLTAIEVKQNFNAYKKRFGI